MRTRNLVLGALVLAVAAEALPWWGNSKFFSHVHAAGIVVPRAGEAYSYYPTDGVQFISSSGNNGNTGLSPHEALAADAIGFSEAYFNLPPTGGTIFVSGASANLSSGVTFGTLKKPVRIVCQPGAGTTLNFSLTSATMFSFDWGFTPGARNQLRGGIYGCNLVGSGGTSIGVELSGANGGGMGAVFDGAVISGFGTNLDWSSSGTPGFLVTARNSRFDDATVQAINFSQGNENFKMFGGSISENAIGVNFQPSGTYGLDANFFSVSFDSNTGCAIQTNTYALQVNLFAPHIEDNQASESPFICQTGGIGQVINIYAPTFVDDFSVGTRDALITQTGPNADLNISDPTVFSNQSITHMVATSAPSDTVTGSHIYDANARIGNLVQAPGAFADLNAASLSFQANGGCNQQISEDGSSTVSIASSCGPVVTFPQTTGIPDVLVSRGFVALSDGFAWHGFSTRYVTTASPVCTATDTTATNAVKIGVTGSANDWSGVYITGTGSDVIAWSCGLPAN